MHVDATLTLTFWTFKNNTSNSDSDGAECTNPSEHAVTLIYSNVNITMA